ncbi:hypothetical protein [Sedimentibacter sp.]|uniref:hypothetical protein n=1 Tax=Sedimentibacter sp. TaxID=1960295 RepID=UPI0028A11FCC|nr:hypothetical protein [Sedimentibacter sp.]
MYKQFIFWKTLLNSIVVGLISIFIYLDIATPIDRTIPLIIFLVILILFKLIFYNIRKKNKFEKEKKNTNLNIIAYICIGYGNRYNEKIIFIGYTLYIISSLLEYRHAVSMHSEDIL